MQYYQETALKVSCVLHDKTSRYISMCNIKKIIIHVVILRWEQVMSQYKKKTLLTFAGDEISGISVSVRERDDIVTIWNTQSQLAEQSKILEKVKELVPEVAFTASFYKGRDGKPVLSVVLTSMCCVVWIEDMYMFWWKF